MVHLQYLDLMFALSGMIPHMSRIAPKLLLREGKIPLALGRWAKEDLFEVEC